VLPILVQKHYSTLQKLRKAWEGSFLKFPAKAHKHNLCIK
jgi:hypothetical protein